MSNAVTPVLSVVIPVFNEAAGLAAFHENLVKTVEATAEDYELIYCDDGSTDGSAAVLAGLSPAERVRIITFSRNFGKELATTAGIHAARGQAVITIDGDGQHPVDLIPTFLSRWRAGSRVVIGVCVQNRHTSWVKRLNSRLFYGLFNRFTGFKLVPGSTDFRLIDRTVQHDFNQMTERSRITRGMIDWLGYRREYVEFEAGPRLAGDAVYSFSKLVKLAIDSVVSLSIAPLFLTIYVGLIILPLSVLLGLFMAADTIVGDPLGLHITGSAYVIVLMLFLIGLLLVSQGIMGLYLSHIHTETQNRPLYIIDQAASRK